MEILARLPVQSLLRFLCVSKSWYDLIKSPNFISTHFNYASSDDNASRIVVINGSDEPCTATILSNDAVEIYHDVPNSFLLDIHQNCILMSSSCNGVICVCDFGGIDDFEGIGDFEGIVVKRVALWNPAIREVNNLVLDDGIANGYKEVTTLIGFGLDTKSNAYKVVRCRKFKSLLDHYFVVDVYDVGNYNDSWRKLDVHMVDGDMDRRMDLYQGSVYADGLCYWPINCTSGFRFVLSFDFINEVFEWIPMPRESTHTTLPMMATFGESVAFAGLSLDHDCYMVWVLNREGEKKTWCKQFSLPKEYGLFPRFRFFRNGKVVMLCDGGLVLYDPKSKECKELVNVYYADIMNYVESLVSFKIYFPPFPKLQISAWESLHNEKCCSTFS